MALSGFGMKMLLALKDEFRSFHSYSFFFFKSLRRFHINSREGDGTPLQYSCLENPMDGGAWWAAVHGVRKSQT